MLVNELIRRGAVRFGDRPALRFGDDSLTFTQVDRLSTRLARALIETGRWIGEKIGKPPISALSRAGGLPLKPVAEQVNVA